MERRGLRFVTPGNRLFHYRRFDTAIKYILPDRTLRLNPIIGTNDPRENRSFVFSALSKAGFDVNSLSERNKQISDNLRGDVKVLCFSTDRPNHFGFEWSRMWALYGGNHTGVCLEIDKEEFLKENAELINSYYLKDIQYRQFNLRKQQESKQINYIELERMGETKYLREVFRPDHLDYLFYTKDDEWTSEAEVRLLHFSDRQEEEFCSIKKSLRNIYLGVDFNEELHLEELKKHSHDIGIAKLEYVDVKLVPSKIIQEVILEE